MQLKRLQGLVFSSVFAALIFLGTFSIRIPTAAGYIHFGDGLILLAATFLPLPGAMAAAAIGGVLADLVAGFAIYAPFTGGVKLLMALVVGLILKKREGYTFMVAAALGAGLVNTAGYFAADCALYDFGAALAALAPNALQSLAGAGIFLLLRPVCREAFHRFRRR